MEIQEPIGRPRRNLVYNIKMYLKWITYVDVSWGQDFPGQRPVGGYYEHKDIVFGIP
jgi:hypothetical protein